MWCLLWLFTGQMDTCVHMLVFSAVAYLQMWAKPAPVATEIKEFERLPRPNWLLKKACNDRWRVCSKIDTCRVLNNLRLGPAALGHPLTPQWRQKLHYGHASNIEAVPNTLRAIAHAGPCLGAKRVRTAHKELIRTPNQWVSRCVCIRSLVVLTRYTVAHD